MLLCGKVAKNY